MKYYYSNATGEYVGARKPVGDQFGFTREEPIEVAEGESVFFIDGEWVAVAPEPEAEPIPTSVSMCQARLQLLEMNLLDQVEDMISGNRKAEIEWETATSVDRDSALVQQLASDLDLNESKVDGLMLAASKIKCGSSL